MPTKTKFWHLMQPKRLRCTVAVDVCDKETLLELMHKMLVRREQASYKGKFGVARVNPNDKYYVKKLGRETSVANSVEANYHLMSVEPWQNGTKYQFAVETLGTLDRGLMKINLFVLPDNNVVHISFVDVTQIKRR